MAFGAAGPLQPAVADIGPLVGVRRGALRGLGPPGVGPLSARCDSLRRDRPDRRLSGGPFRRARRKPRGTFRIHVPAGVRPACRLAARRGFRSAAGCGTAHRQPAVGSASAGAVCRTVAEIAAGGRGRPAGTIHSSRGPHRSQGFGALSQCLDHPLPVSLPTRPDRRDGGPRRWHALDPSHRPGRRPSRAGARDVSNGGRRCGGELRRSQGRPGE